MNKKLIALVSLSVIIVVVIFAALLVSRDPKPVSLPKGETTAIPFPEGSSRIAVTGRDGQIEVNNFLDDTDTTAVEGVEYPLYAVGETEVTSEYHIHFAADYSLFTITLLTEPLGEARIAAEEYLSEKLGISRYQLCFLNYTVGTTASISPDFAGYNLGFSQCPGSTQL